MPLDKNQKQFLNKAEDVAEEIFRTTKHILPHIARLCLLATFLEDGIRMYFQWNDQITFMNDRWSCGQILATVFVVVNFFGQLVPCVCILIRKFIEIACCVLFGILILQMFAYNIIWDLHFLAKYVGVTREKFALRKKQFALWILSFAVGGGLVLLLAETRVEKNSLFAGVPTIGDSNKAKSWMQLVGRILLMIMFLSLLSFQFNFYRIFELIVGGFFMILIGIGYKTKLCSFVLVILLTCVNFYLNRWWLVSEDSWYRDFLKYDFFQTLSIIGGLLMVVVLGPGHVSVDDYKKRW